jgi:hypothetical protein
VSKRTKDNDSLRLVTTKPEADQPKKPAPLPPANNFWNTCPRKLDYLPNSPCEQGKRACETKGAEGCPWSINSGEHNYCFWKWVRANSLPNGQMRPLLQNEIAQLDNCSPTKIHFTEKDAKAKLKESGHLDTLVNLLSGNESGSDDSEVNSLVDQIEETLPPDDVE